MGFHCVPKSQETSWVALAKKALSLWGKKDYPNLGRISVTKAFMTSDALSDLHAHASTHPVKVSTILADTGNFQ